MTRWVLVWALVAGCVSGCGDDDVMDVDSGMPPADSGSDAFVPEMDAGSDAGPRRGRTRTPARPPAPGSRPRPTGSVHQDSMMSTSSSVEASGEQERHPTVVG